jgi:TRAP-type C4-dicarboxylate transport system substrate-binding protein
MRLSLFLTTAILLVGVFIVDCPNTLAKRQKILRLVVPAAAGDPLTVRDETMAKRFNARANGEYKIQVFPGESLAKIPEYFDAVRVGAVEMADIAWGIFAGLDPRLSLIETPFLFNNFSAGVAAAKRLLPLHDTILQQRFNAKALGLMHLSGVELISTKPAKTLEDWKGLLVGAISPILSAMVKELGGSPVTIMWTDLYTSLQKGVIDGTTTGTHGSLETGLMDVCSHVTIFFGAAAWNGYSINLGVWNDLPENIQQIMQEEIEWAVDWTHNMMAKWEDEDMQAYKRLGTKVHIVPMAEREKWGAVLRPLKEEQLRRMGDLGLRVKQIADDVNARYPYHVRTIKK